MTTTNGLAAYAHIQFLNPKEARFSKTVGGLLALQYGDTHYDNVNIHRTFPFSHPDTYLSVRDKDGKEIGIIKSVATFDDEAQQLVAEELERRYFMPTIVEVTNVKEEFGYAYWEVETDRGARRFTIRRRQESVVVLDAKRILIIDVDGNRYEIPDIGTLDTKTSRLLDALI